MSPKLLKVERVVERLQAIDWDFYSGKISSNGSFHWYPSRFVSALPSILIGNLSTKGESVLDPFVGCGTTVLEAVRIGRLGIGIDLNPVGILSAKAQLTRLSNRALRQIQSDVVAQLDSVRSTDSQLYNGDARYWYHRETLAELNRIRNLIDKQRRRAYYTLLKATFSAILNSVCSRREHFGWICDNVRPKELVYIDARKTFLQKLTQALRANAKFFKYFDLIAELPSDVSKMHTLLCGNASSVMDDIANDSVSLVVTSPPYFGVTDYMKSFRLYGMWFADEFDLDVRTEEIGARYKRHRRTAKSDYLAELVGVLRSARDKLRRGRYLVLVLGQSKKRADYIDDLRNLLEDSGLTYVHSVTRNIPVQRRLSPSILQEQIVIYRKS